MLTNIDKADTVDMSSHYLIILLYNNISSCLTDQTPQDIKVALSSWQPCPNHPLPPPVFPRTKVQCKRVWPITYHLSPSLSPSSASKRTWLIFPSWEHACRHRCHHSHLAIKDGHILSRHRITLA